MTLSPHAEILAARDVLQRAVDTWPIAGQALVLAEECGELVAAVSRVIRGRTLPHAELPGELADVLVMVEQMIAHWRLDERVGQAVRDKVERVRVRLEGAR